MKSRNDTNRFEEAARDVTDYCRLQFDAVKLRALESLAVLFNNIFSTLVLVVLVSIALLFLSVALTVILARATGSLTGATLIIAAVFLIAAIVIYALRNKLIVNPLVRMLSKLMFGKDKMEED